MADTKKDLSEHSAAASSTAGDNDKKKKKKVAAPQASTGETMSFVFGCGTKTIGIWCLGMLGALGNGAVSHATCCNVENEHGTEGCG